MGLIQRGCPAKYDPSSWGLLGNDECMERGPTAELLVGNNVNKCGLLTKFMVGKYLCHVFTYSPILKCPTTQACSQAVMGISTGGSGCPSPFPVVRVPVYLPLGQLFSQGEGETASKAAGL